MTDATRKVISARTSLVIEQPFFGSLALSLHIQEDTTCKTAWVDGRTLGYNPDFINSLSHEKVTALVAHEVMHCALGHPWRRDARSMKNWNVACDKTINTELQSAGFILPDDAYYAEGDEVGKSSEWIFARMGEDEPDPNGGGGNSDSMGELRDAPQNDDANGDGPPTEQEWKERVQGAMAQAKMAKGSLPAGLSRLVKDSLVPRIDVRSLLLRFFSERATADYAWSRPNPRYIAHGLYLPSLESRGLGEIGILVDTSGSVDEVSLQYVRGILEQVIDECQPAGVTVYFVDTKIQHVERIERGEPLVWNPKGGGGTNFESFFEEIETLDTPPVCVIGISDLEANFGPSVSSVPVLWLTDRVHGVAPFGETVFVDR